LLPTPLPLARTALMAAVGACLQALATPTSAQEGMAGGGLGEVVVSATREPQARREVAASIDVVNASTLREMGPQVNLSEALQKVPGLAVLNRQNYAQDLQLSSRGFGARSAFGVRGVRLYADGIPLTMPDGQGQTALFDLGSAERIEVLRGPASSLYGNAAGGVVQVFTEEGPPQPEFTAGLALGRDGLQRQSVKLAGQQGDLNYVLSASHFETDGWRQHSGAQRDQFNGKLVWALQGGARLSLVASYLNMPEVQDPLGLPLAQWRANPQQADAAALDFNTRKAIENQQVGVVYEQPVRSGHDTLRFMVYEGNRQVRQYQAITTGAQTPARHPGGVIDFSRDYQGLDARYTWRHTLAGGPLQVSGGINIDSLMEARRGYQNFTGSGASQLLGVLGPLRRDEANTALNHDLYAQAQWAPTPQWDVGLGLRRSHVLFTSSDQYIVPGNGDDSGRMDFAATTPTASVMFKPLQALHVYATAGRSFETPTLNEVAYRSNLGTATGWNTALKASRAKHWELGAKTLPWPGLSLDAAVFHIDTLDEIAVDVNAGGRATYRNVGRTERRGLEVSSQWKVAREWTAQTALTFTQARYLDAFASSAVQGSSTTNSNVAAGNALPGVPRRQLYAELAWRPAGTGWHTALEVRHMGRIWANDVNIEQAGASSIYALRAAWRTVLPEGWRLSTLARVDNLTDRMAVGSVIVNEGNKRYYEGAPGRSLLLGASVTKVF
jgi:iron complex outermembrane receptor protein